MSRLTIDITEQQHQTLRIIAALQGKTIKEYAVERLFSQPAVEEQALTELKQMLEQRLIEAARGEISEKSIGEIAEEVLRDGGLA